MANRNRDRGLSAEREVAKILEDHLAIPVSRVLGQERDSGNDIILSKYSIQVKYQRAWRIKEWFDEAKERTVPGMTPVLVFRRPREDWLVTMRLIDFIALVREDLFGGVKNDK